MLLTGLNYRAVEVLTHKLLEAVNGLLALKCRIYKAHSRSKTASPLSVTKANPHVTGAVDPWPDDSARVSRT